MQILNQWARESLRVAAGAAPQRLSCIARFMRMRTSTPLAVARKPLEAVFGVCGGTGTLAGFWGCVWFRILNVLCRPTREKPPRGLRRWLFWRFGLGGWTRDKLLFGEWTAFGLGVGLTVGLVLYLGQ